MLEGGNPVRGPANILLEHFVSSHFCLWSKSLVSYTSDLQGWCIARDSPRTSQTIAQLSEETETKKDLFFCILTLRPRKA